MICESCINYNNEICLSEKSWYYMNKIEGKIMTCPGFEQEKKETVNHPQHYNKGIEAIDIIESWDLNFSLGNAIKYILRAPHKSNQIEDLKKAKWYVEREIERLEKTS